MYIKMKKYFEQELLTGKLRLKLKENIINECLNLGYIREIELIIDGIKTNKYDLILNESNINEFRNWILNDFSSKITVSKNDINNWKNDYNNGRNSILPKDWDNPNMKSYCSFYKGKNLSKNDIIENGLNECIHYGELFTKYNIKTTTILSRTDISKQGAFLSKNGDLLMPGSDVTPKGLATAVCILKDNVIIGGDTIVIRPINNIDSIFLSYKINYAKSYIIPVITGSVVKHLYPKNLNLLQFEKPILILEQILISTFLSNIDNLIDNYKKIIE